MDARTSVEEKILLLDTEVNKRKFMDAVRKADVETVKKLIGEGLNINFHLYDLTPLHAALQGGRNMDMLELLLSQPNIDLNILNEMKETPLLWSFGISSHQNNKLQLIRAGCDINISNEKKETPLHLSLQYPSITLELLKQGADVNAFCSRYGTALHYAVISYNLELVCMLLYYNADVCIKWRGDTPFSLGLFYECFEIVKVLSDYYDKYIIDCAELCISFLQYGNSELFKAVWPRFDPKMILSRCPAFINCYLRWCEYSTSVWVECLYLILNSDIAFDLIEHCILNTHHFFYNLLKSMWERDVESEDRIGLLYMVLGLGFEIKINDINAAVVIYGLNQDLEPFIYATYSSITDSSKFICPLHAFVIGMETDYSIKKISQLFHDASEEWIRQSQDNSCFSLCNEDIFAKTCTKPVAFFSFPGDVKNDIINLYTIWADKICQFGRVYHQSAYVTMLREQLQEIPEFPSLTELSRNQIHKYLVEKFRFKQPYQLQDCVKKLLIPNKIKDIILFKEPIY